MDQCKVVAVIRGSRSLYLSRVVNGKSRSDHINSAWVSGSKSVLDDAKRVEASTMFMVASCALSPTLRTRLIVRQADGGDEDSKDSSTIVRVFRPSWWPDTDQRPTRLELEWVLWHMPQTLWA